MATLNHAFTDLGRHDDVRLVRVPARRQRAALGRLLGGGGSDARVDSFLRFANHRSLSLDHLWAAHVAKAWGEPAAVVLIVPSPGRTAMLFLSPVEAGPPQQIAAELIRSAVAGLKPGEVSLVQALIDPWQHDEADTLAAAGFRKLAHLLYMQRAAEAPDAAMTLDPSLRRVPWADASRDFFARAIAASYEQTSDCPGLLGLRRIEDVIAGHLATGRFDPDLWLGLGRGDDPVGVLLANPVLNQQALEVVYLGVSPAWRGRGIGRTLMHHAIHLAADRDLGHLILAVDELNEPATRMYRSLGFTNSARKLALIQTIPASR